MTKKNKGIDTSLYYSPNQLLSYNRVLNFTIGPRGYGKTYGIKKHCVKRFLKHGEQFIYIKRFKGDISKVKSFFENLAKDPDFEGVQFEVKGKEFFIDGQLAGFAIALSRWQTEKSNEYPDVHNVFFDEFLREKDLGGHIPNEPKALLSLLDTIFRNKVDCRCICAGNSVSIVNDYFTYLGAIPDARKRFNAYDDYVIEITDSPAFTNARKETPFGKLISKTDYGEMALNNEFVNDCEVFITKRTKRSKYQFSVVYKGMTLGVWTDINEGLMYLSQDHDPSSRKVFALTRDDMNDRRQYATRRNYFIKKMVNTFNRGELRFDSQLMRTIGYEIMKKLNID
ncbi:terminase [Bacillus phage Harambe]|uniref:DNA encapsidation protein n=2 Tax=Harambevirus TaxID=2842721 RepID=A0A1W6JSE7_9CAUD|nr:terminase [Bacillus phage Harambe]YP_009910203.1 terminase [Bacillus phage BeachBum]ARM70176.1 DNA encapsidation protein [Bacillus phage Harambe]ARQ95204.1 DNA encapsidation protein [Bacillus phage BeachBum]